MLHRIQLNTLNVFHYYYNNYTIIYPSRLYYYQIKYKICLFMF